MHFQPMIPRSGGSKFLYFICYKKNSCTRQEVESNFHELETEHHVLQQAYFKNEFSKDNHYESAQHSIDRCYSQS